MDQDYIGDGVYVSHDGYQILIAADRPDNKVVAIEPSVMRALVRYAKRIGHLHDGDA